MSHSPDVCADVCLLFVWYVVHGWRYIFLATFTRGVMCCVRLRPHQKPLHSNSAMWIRVGRSAVLGTCNAFTSNACNRHAHPLRLCLLLPLHQHHLLLLRRPRLLSSNHSSNSTAPTFRCADIFIVSFSAKNWSQNLRNRHMLFANCSRCKCLSQQESGCFTSDMGRARARPFLRGRAEPEESEAVCMLRLSSIATDFCRNRSRSVAQSSSSSKESLASFYLKVLSAN